MANKQEQERERIRAKLSEDDRAFMDSVREVFPNAKLTWVKFSDGEEIGRKR